MSAYQYQAPAVTRDPTAVVGRRTVAAIVDGLIVSVPAALVVSADFEYLEESDVGVPLDDFCDVVQDRNDVVACAQAGDRVYFAEDVSPLGSLLGLGLSLLLLVVLQGISGLTPGKALLGIRTVGEDGRPPGLGKAIVRWLLLIVDWFPWCAPLLGFVLVLSTTGHRRLGDMAAKTFVVSKADAGQPIVVPGMASPYAAAGYPPGAVPPGPGWGPAPGAPGAPGSGDAWGTAPGPPAAPPGSAPAPGSVPGSGDAWGTPPGAYGAPQPPAGAWAPSTGETPAVPSPAPAPADDEPDPTMTFGAGAAGAPTSSDAVPAASRAEPGEPGASVEPAAAPAGGYEPDRPTTVDPAATPVSASAEDEATTAGEAGDAGEAPTPAGSEPDRATAADTSPSSAYEPDQPTRADESATGAPAAGGYEPDQPTRAEGSDTEVLGTVPPDSPLDVEPPAQPEAQAQPQPDPVAETGQPAAGAPGAGAGAGAAGAQATYNPQWDAARGTYIVWEPGRGKWLGWDDTAKEWKPL